MLTEATLEFHTPTQIASSTFGLDPPPSPFSHGSIPTCGNSPISSIGMTKRFCLSNTTGKRHVKRISHTSSSGISTWTRTTGIPIIITGLCTFLRLSDCVRKPLLDCLLIWFVWVAKRDCYYTKA